MTRPIPFAYSVSGYEAESDGAEGNHGAVRGGPNPRAYGFSKKRRSSVPFPFTWVGEDAAKTPERTSQYCLQHARKFATMEDLSLPT
jgi:hypothetical protein